MRLVILGAPGSGKGTQAFKIVDEYGIPSISTGDILRAHMAEGTALGTKAAAYIEAGKLVPDDLIIEIAMRRIDSEDCKKGFLLDGFPRTVEQAVALDRHMLGLGIKLDKAINIRVEMEVLISRITGRRVCSDCGASFHIMTLPPKIRGVCDECGGELLHRSDDYEETVRNRIQVYHEQSETLADYYRAEGLLVEVDGMKEPCDVFSDIQRVLKDL
ncbi:adenylate kinase [Clostridia bacterium]|nr:adenylate kinase [Clostridia bacterium]